MRKHLLLILILVLCMPPLASSAELPDDVVWQIAQAIITPYWSEKGNTDIGYAWIDYNTYNDGDQYFIYSHIDYKDTQLKKQKDSFMLHLARNGDSLEPIALYIGADIITVDLLRSEMIAKEPATEPIETPLAKPAAEETTSPTGSNSSADTWNGFGELLEYSDIVDGICVLKYKIEPSYNNNATIEQNYFNVEKFILDGGGDQFEEIQYWAIADMIDGSEGKVISFTVPHKLIQLVHSRNIVAIQLGNYVDDLWILPSLLD